MPYHVYKKAKNASWEENFELHGSFNSADAAKKAQDILKGQGFRTRRNATRNDYRIV